MEKEKDTAKKARKAQKCSMGVGVGQPSCLLPEVIIFDKKMPGLVPEREGRVQWWGGGFEALFSQPIFRPGAGAVCFLLGKAWLGGQGRVGRVLLLPASQPACLQTQTHTQAWECRACFLPFLSSVTPKEVPPP